MSISASAQALRKMIAKTAELKLSSAAAGAVIQDFLLEMSEDEAEALLYDWDGIWARPEQQEPLGAWLFWLILAGRGFGKSRTGAETVRRWAVEMPGSRGFIAARTIAEARDICIEGESGLLACLPSAQRPPFGGEWNRSKGELWLGSNRANATYTKCFSSEEPDSARGFQAHWGWADELAAWLKSVALWDQLLLGLRLPWPGRDARAVITTTPRPLKVIRDLLKDPKTVVTRGTTYDNLSNLTPAFRTIISKFEGTRLGRQELFAEMLDDTPGALWTRALLDKNRLPAVKPADTDFDYVLVAVDPSATSSEESAETGIVVGGRRNGKGFTIDDKSLRGKPHEWAQVAVDAFHEWRANAIVAEANNGGEMVAATIHAIDPAVPVELVWASRGKRTRAEPVSTAYEQGTIRHCGTFERLEDQMCTWIPGETSPDRMDANVWLHTKLEDSSNNGKVGALRTAVRTGVGAGGM